MKFILITHAGGSKYQYLKFCKGLDEFYILEYPGRGFRIKETLLNNLDLLMKDLLPIIEKEITLNNRYIIYGHSMGALVGYLICQQIEELGLRKPIKLVVSGKKSPSIQRELKLAHLPAKEFWKEVIKMGGVPNEIQYHPDLMEFYTPILKADFTAIESYQYIKKEKLTIPIDVFYGSEEATVEEMTGWQEETTEKVSINQLEGNHFFIFNHIDYFRNYFNNLILE